MDIVKVSVLGITGIFLCLFLKETKPEYSLYISLSVCFVIIGFSVSKIMRLFENIREIQSYISIQKEYLNTLIRILGIAYLGQFSSGICKDAGYSSMAGQIETFCKLSIMVMSMPIMLALLKTISGFLA